NPSSATTRPIVIIRFMASSSECDEPPSRSGARTCPFTRRRDYAIPEEALGKLRQMLSEDSSSLSFVELVLALRGRQSGRNTAAVHQTEHGPFVLAPVLAPPRRGGATRCPPSLFSEPPRGAEPHRPTPRGFFSPPQKRRRLVLPKAPQTD